MSIFRDIVGCAGFAAVTIGVTLGVSVAWGLVVGGLLMLGYAIASATNHVPPKSKGEP